MCSKFVLGGTSMMILMWLLSMRGELMSQTRPSSLVMQLPVMSWFSWQTAQCLFVLVFMRILSCTYVSSKSCSDALMWCDVMLWCNVVWVLSLHIMSCMGCLVISCHITCFFFISELPLQHCYWIKLVVLCC